MKKLLPFIEDKTTPSGEPKKFHSNKKEASAPHKLKALLDHLGKNVSWRNSGQKITQLEVESLLEVRPAASIGCSLSDPNE
jgi:hypothetical protein